MPQATKMSMRKMGQTFSRITLGKKLTTSYLKYGSQVNKIVHLQTSEKTATVQKFLVGLEKY